MLTFLWCYGQDGIINMRTSIAEYLSYVSVHHESGNMGSMAVYVTLLWSLFKAFPNACLCELYIQSCFCKPVLQLFQDIIHSWAFQSSEQNCLSVDRRWLYFILNMTRYWMDIYTWKLANYWGKWTSITYKHKVNFYWNSFGCVESIWIEQNNLF